MTIFSSLCTLFVEHCAEISLSQGRSHVSAIGAIDGCNCASSFSMALTLHINSTGSHCRHTHAEVSGGIEDGDVKTGSMEGGWVPLSGCGYVTGLKSDGRIELQCWDPGPKIQDSPRSLGAESWTLEALDLGSGPGFKFNPSIRDRIQDQGFWPKNRDLRSWILAGLKFDPSIRISIVSRNGLGYGENVCNT